MLHDIVQNLAWRDDDHELIGLACRPNIGDDLPRRGVFYAENVYVLHACCFQDEIRHKRGLRNAICQEELVDDFRNVRWR
ncbi:MAG: hypothetical protein KA034_01460 [Candidatus Moranbacteria bacterium]|nr:hypothetical protein [Candidatus Moranbacteria bacterium]